MACCGRATRTRSTPPGSGTAYHHDRLGSTRYTSDISGTTFPQILRFDAFGNRSATGGIAPYTSTDLQFAGDWGYQTEWSGGSSDPGLGLQYLGQRYYDPAIGRFISPDPIGTDGGLNLYGYAGNDPVVNNREKLSQFRAGRTEPPARRPG
jgi:RHS repeat-associated protein